MSVKPIREYHGKKILEDLLPRSHATNLRGASVGPDVLDPTRGQSWDSIVEAHPWLLEQKLVAKPDQLVKRRGKHGLIAVNLDFEDAKSWVMERMNKEIEIDGVKGMLTNFLIEPFLPHAQKDEYYVCIQCHRYFDEIYFFHEGGVDVGDVDAKATRMRVPIERALSGPEHEILLGAEEVRATLLSAIPNERKARVASFICDLYLAFQKANFVYLEINPLLVTDTACIPLDVAAKLDECAAFLSEPLWQQVEFPAPFGRAAYPEELFISELDAKTGASLKLTVLNIHGSIWTMVAGGGASVVFADTVCECGFNKELANYGEYSGAPTTEETRLYARTILSLMTRYRRDGPKYLIVGGGIANFTDVAGTFKGLITAIEEFRDELIEHNVKIWVRRGGLNHIEGLRLIRDKVRALGVEIHVYGPEAPMTSVVPMALGLADVMPENFEEESSGKPSKSPVVPETPKVWAQKPCGARVEERHPHISHGGAKAGVLQLSEETQCIVYNLQTAAVQRMLDFDAMCNRKTPSVAAMVFPFGGQQNIKVYWGTKEIFIPVYTKIAQAVEKHPQVSLVVNFASFRSVWQSTLEALEHHRTIKTIAIIAEGVPEKQTRMLICKAEAVGVGIIGPATVGGITPGGFRIGNTGGAIENLTMSKLYRAGSVCYVSKSGGMSNELNNIIARCSDGVCDGVAIGGDRYPGSRFIDHVIRFEDNPKCAFIVLFGEVGGVDEYDVIEAVQSGRVTKPVIGWCNGTCAGYFDYEVQFGHAGAQARGKAESASAKNAAMKKAGILVPKTFTDIGVEIEQVYRQLVGAGKLQPVAEPAVPVTPKDFSYLQKLGVVRKAANFVSSISDDRGEELTYSGMPIQQVVGDGLGVGGAVSLLWFRKRLPDECLRFIEMALVVCADHGPAVSGAHNTIVASRAGKDLVSSLASGLLTIGPRFGGALDDAARGFTPAADAGANPAQYVTDMKKANKLIMGIGHRIKSKTNPDKRVEIIKEFALKHFMPCTVLNFALGVEDVTTSKKGNLILNVDGAIACAFVDMLRSSGAFSKEEITGLIEDGCLNGLFVLARSIGLIGHFLDQKRLKQPLYRHPWDDITYM